MFVRKLLSMNNKVAWAFIDLMMIIIGVYCAFLIQQYSETERTKRDEERIMSALKYELEILRFSTPIYADDTKNRLQNWTKSRDNESYSDFSGWRFVEPQYSFQIVEHAVDLDNTDIVDFELYSRLQNLLIEIKKAEYAERKITEVSMRYKSLPATLNSKSNEFLLLNQENFDNFNRFILFSEDRANILPRVANASATALEIINSRMDPLKKKEIERQLLLENIGIAPSVDHAIGLVKQFFPDFTEEEVREIYEKNQAQ